MSLKTPCNAYLIQQIVTTSHKLLRVNKVSQEFSHIYTNCCHAFDKSALLPRSSANRGQMGAKDASLKPYMCLS